jgi:hypothetical protein
MKETDKNQERAPTSTHKQQQTIDKTPNQEKVNRTEPQRRNTED